MMRVSARRVIVPFLALACAFYLPTLFFADAAFFTEVLTPKRHAAIGAVAKLACLVTGVVYGLLCARRLERTNPSRLPWLLLALWLFGFVVGQSALMVYERFLEVPAPVPSIGDAGFFAGYALMIAAAVRFVFVSRASGLPVGSAREHLLLAAVAVLVLAAIGYPVLAPIARTDAPAVERFVNVAYPVLDFVALVPTLVMIRVALAFRPGKIWTVWAALLVGFAFMAVGDILFAYASTAGSRSMDPLVDLTLLTGYFFAACGTKLQNELLSD